MTTRKGEPYKPGELEIILSLAPTRGNIENLAKLLERSKGAVSIVYKVAYEGGTFGKTADIQRRKILAAKKALDIRIGPMKLS